MSTSHKLYRAIVDAVLSQRLTEPFAAQDVRRACPEFAKSTPGTFLPKHRRGNPGGNSELFERVSRGRYCLIHPLKYGLQPARGAIIVKRLIAGLAALALTVSLTAWGIEAAPPGKAKAQLSKGVVKYGERYGEWVVDLLKVIKRYGRGSGEMGFYDRQMAVTESARVFKRVYENLGNAEGESASGWLVEDIIKALDAADAPTQAFGWGIIFGGARSIAQSEFEEAERGRAEERARRAAEEEARSTWKAHYGEGQAKMNEKDYAGAIVRFREVLDQQLAENAPEPGERKVRALLAECQVAHAEELSAAGNLDAAASVMEGALANYGQADTKADMARYRWRLYEWRAALGEKEYKAGELEKAKVHLLKARALENETSAHQEIARAPLPGRIDEMLQDIEQKEQAERLRREQAEQRARLKEQAEREQAERRAARSRRWSRVWRSTLLPGWGQIREAQWPVRGQVGEAHGGEEPPGSNWVGLTALLYPVSLGTAYLTWRGGNNAYEEYRQAKTKPQADEAWDRTIRNDRWTAGLLGTAGGLWLGSWLDAILSDPVGKVDPLHTRLPGTERNVAVGIVPAGPSGLQVAVHVRY